MACGAVGGGVAAVAGADVAKQRAHAGEAVAIGRGVQLTAQGAHVQALAQGGGLGIGPGVQGLGLGQGRQAVRQGKVGLRAPQAHQAGQLLALQGRVQAGAGQLGGGVVLHAQLLGLLQLAEVADQGHAPGQLAAGCGGLVHAFGRLQALLRRHGPQPGAAGVGGVQQHLLGGGERGLLQLPALPAAAPRQGDELDQVDAELALDLALMAVDEAPQRQRGVEQGQGLGALRILAGQLCQLGLQAGAAQQGRCARPVSASTGWLSHWAICASVVVLGAGIAWTATGCRQAAGRPCGGPRRCAGHRGPRWRSPPAPRRRARG